MKSLKKAVRDTKKIARCHNTLINNRHCVLKNNDCCTHFELHNQSIKGSDLIFPFTILQPKLSLSQVQHRKPTMKSIFSILSVLAFFAAAVYAEECECKCTNKELEEASDLVTQMTKNIEACNYRASMHEKVKAMYEQNNKLLSQSMKAVNKVEEKANSKHKSSDWRKEKKKLVTNYNDLKEDKKAIEEAHERKTKDLNKQIDSLKAELESLKAAKEE